MSFRYAHGNVQLLHVIYLWTCHLIIQQNRFKTLNTYSLQQSPSWEANQFSASQEIPRILWNPKVHYRIHKSPSPVPILNQTDLAHAPTSHFLKIHLNIILQSTPGCSKWSLSLRFPHQNPLLSTIRATCLALKYRRKTFIFHNRIINIFGSKWNWTVQELSNSRGYQNLFLLCLLMAFKILQRFKIISYTVVYIWT